MNCRVCESNSYKKLIDFGSQPVVHHLLDNKNQKYEKYPFQLNYCEVCGFICIDKPIHPNILYKNYFTISSWKPQPHIARLIDLINCFNDNDILKTKILDIGCNDGSFLDELKEKGFQNIYGIEPTKDTYELCKIKHENTINDFFSLKKAKSIFNKNFFDIIISRQVLEHIIELNDFLDGINHILKEEGILILEIPDFGWNLSNLDYSLWEEHVNYFTYESLDNLLRKNNFSIFHWEVTLFAGTALTVFAQKSKKKEKDYIYNNNQYKKVNNYKNALPLFKEEFSNFLKISKKDIKVYGCGARSSTLINLLDLGDKVSCYIDDQAEKQNKFIPGSLTEIRAWDEKKDHSSILLLGVNTESESKLIRKRKLKNKSFYSILPPSPRLPFFWKKQIENLKN